MTKKRIPIKPLSRQGIGNNDNNANFNLGLNDSYMNAFLISVQGNNDGCKASIDHKTISEKDYVCNAKSCNYAKKIEVYNR